MLQQILTTILVTIIFVIDSPLVLTSLILDVIFAKSSELKHTIKADLWAYREYVWNNYVDALKTIWSKD